MIFFIIGNSKASLGNICTCLCGCDDPESGPELKNNKPYNAFTTKMDCRKSPSVSSFDCASNSFVTTSKWFVKMLNLLYSKRWLGSNYEMNRPFLYAKITSSNGGRNGFLSSFYLFFSFSFSLEITKNNMFSSLSSEL